MKYIGTYKTPLMYHRNCTVVVVAHIVVLYRGCERDKIGVRVDRTAKTQKKTVTICKPHRVRAPHLHRRFGLRIRVIEQPRHGIDLLRVSLWHLPRLRGSHRHCLQPHVFHHLQENKKRKGSSIIPVEAFIADDIK